MSDNKRKIVQVDLDNNLEASIARVNELKAGRKTSDIPMNDEYWKAVQKHHAARDAGWLK
jgi:hypothetical protein